MDSAEWKYMGAQVCGDEWDEYDVDKRGRFMGKRRERCL